MKYLPILMLVSLQKGGLNQITFLFLPCPSYFYYVVIFSAEINL